MSDVLLACEALLVVVLVGRYFSRLSQWHADLANYRRALEDYHLRNSPNAKKPGA